MKYYSANITSDYECFLFGMIMPNSQNLTGATKYRYGFNGKEKDDEISGSGNSYDYGFRIYNPRLGRFLSVDPLAKSFPYLTPYQFAENTPVFAIDLDGLEATYIPPSHGAALHTIEVSIDIINNNYIHPAVLEKFKLSLQTEINRVFSETKGKLKYQLLLKYKEGATIRLVLNNDALGEAGANVTSERGNSQYNVLLLNTDDIDSESDALTEMIRVFVAIQEILNTLGLEDEDKDKTNRNLSNVAIDAEIRDKISDNFTFFTETLDDDQRNVIIATVGNEQNGGTSKKDERHIQRQINSKINSNYQSIKKSPRKFKRFRMLKNAPKF